MNDFLQWMYNLSKGSRESVDICSSVARRECFFFLLSLWSGNSVRELLLPFPHILVAGAGNEVRISKQRALEWKQHKAVVG